MPYIPLPHGTVHHLHGLLPLGTDHCAGNPCPDGATCLSLPGSYHCLHQHEDTSQGMGHSTLARQDIHVYRCMFNLWLMEFVMVLNIHVVIKEVWGCTDTFPFKTELSMRFVIQRIVRTHYIVARHKKAENKFQFIWTTYNISSVLWDKIWYQYQRCMGTSHYTCKSYTDFYRAHIAVYSDTPPCTSQH